MPSRYLYLVRHGEQQDAEHGLPDGPLSAARRAASAGDRRPAERRAVLGCLDLAAAARRKRPRAS